MERVRRLLAGFAGCAVVMSGLVTPSSSAAALPLESDPPISVSAEPEASTSPDAAAAEATREPAADQAGSSGGDDAKASDDAKVSDDAVKPLAGDNPAPKDDEAKPATGDEPKQSDGDGVKPGDPSSSSAAAVTATAGLLSISATVVADGNAESVDGVAPTSFASHGPVVGLDGRVLDDGPNNGVVAVNDSVIYRITARQPSAPGTQTLVAVLPEGMTWDPTAAAAPNPRRCDVLSRRSHVDLSGVPLTTGDYRMLTCSWTNDGTADEYSILARAWVGTTPDITDPVGTALANGAVVAPVFYNETMSGAGFPGPRLTVVGEPRIPMRIAHTNTVQNELFGGELGVRYELSVWQDAGLNLARGVEAPKRPFDYVLDVPDGAVMMRASVASSTKNGSVSASQSAPGGDVIVTVDGPSTNPFLTKPSNIWVWTSQVFQFFVPYDPFIAETGYTYLATGVSGFDPQGVSGVSNYGDGVAPGQEDTSACPATAAVANGLRCVTVRVQRPVLVPAELRPTTVRVASSSNFGLFERSFATSNGLEKVVPGQAFMTTPGVYNRSNADGSVLGAFGCVTWDVSQLKLTGPASAAISSSGSAFGPYTGNTGSTLGSDRYVVEYASLGLASDAERKAFACGVAGSGDAGGVSWSLSLSADTDAVRVRWLDDVVPDRALGVRVPLARTAAEFPLNTPLPWFWQYGWNADPSTTVLSNYSPGTAAANQTSSSARGASVQAVPAIVHATTAWSRSSTGSGDVVGSTVSPFVIGPVDGPDTVAVNTKVTVTFSSGCVSPVAGSLPSYATLTPPDYGPDGVPCTDDDRAAAIEFDLGDVAAVSGPATGSDRGHQVALPTISFQVLVAPGAKEGSKITATAVISSTSDTPTASGTTYGRSSSAQVAVASAEVLRGFKLASTQVDGWVAPGEEFSYTIGFSNTLRGSFLPAVFVDVLPFAGDSRLQAGERDALSGGGELTLTGVSASMLSASMGEINVFYSTADPATAYATLTGAPDGSDPVFDWKPWPSSGVPAGVTALRFVTSKALDSGDAGIATVSLRAGALGVGVLHNDVFGRVDDDPLSEPELASHGFLGTIRQDLRSSAASFAGTVQRDADFDSAASDTVDAANDSWWPAGGVVELVLDGVVKHTATIGDDGVFDAGQIGAGSYVVRVRDASGWTTLAGGSVTVAAGDVVTGHRVVVRESVADPVLLDDVARVNMADTVMVDVTANDSLPTPTVSVASPARIVLGGTGTTARGGTFVVSSTPGVAYAGQPQVSYTASSVWPAGVSGSSYTDTFTYSWTNVLGVTRSATVTVTVVKAPTATGGTATIPVDGWHAFDADPQGSIVSAAVTAGPSQGAASVDASTGLVTFDATGADPGTYTFTVTWVDDLGQTGTSSYTVTVQAPPTATGGRATIGVDSSHTFDADPQTTGSIASASVTTAPSQGAASVDAATGEVTFDATGADLGTYTFTVTWVDDLGQTGTSTYAVTVVRGETSAVIPVDGSHTFNVEVSSATVTSASVTDGPACDASDGVGSVTSDASGRVVFDGTGVAAGAVCTFEVTFTDVHGQSTPVTFTVTVQAPPTATGGTATIGVDGSRSFDADPQTTGSIASASVTTAPSQGAATVDAGTGEVTFDATGADPGTYTFTVTWTDDLGQTGTSEYTVVVQAGPTASGGTATVPVGGSHTFDADPQTTGSIDSASVTTAPSQGAASVDAASGEVTFDATGADPGTYEFTVTWVDDLGQTGTSTYTVTVEDAPVVTGETSAVIPVDGSHTFELAVSGGAVMSASVTDGPSCDTGDGVGSVTSDTSGRVVFDGAGVAAGAVCTFEVTFTDVYGQSTAVSFTVTVQPPPTASGGEATIPVDGRAGFNGAPQTRGRIATAVVTAGPVQGTASVDGTTGEVMFDGTGAVAGTYTFTVTWTDDLGQTGTSEYTVTVRDLVVVGETESRIPVGGSHAHRPEVNHPDHVVSVEVVGQPARGRVSVDPATGDVSYEAGDATPGVYTYRITWTDDLGQTATLTHTVTVYDATTPTSPPATATPTPTTPEPSPPITVHTTDTPTPSPSTTSPVVVGTGGTVSGGPASGGVAGLMVSGLVLLLAAGFALARRRDVGR